MPRESLETWGRPPRRQRNVLRFWGGLTRGSGKLVPCSLRWVVANFVWRTPLHSAPSTLNPGHIALLPWRARGGGADRCWVFGVTCQWWMAASQHADFLHPGGLSQQVHRFSWQSISSAWHLLSLVRVWGEVRESTYTYLVDSLLINQAFAWLQKIHPLRFLKDPFPLEKRINSATCKSPTPPFVEK